jgi:signal transduction histidine kinase
VSAADLLTYVTHAVFLAIFIRVAIDSVRRPTGTNLNILAFFGTVALLIGQSWVARAVGGIDILAITIVRQSILMAIPYLLLRLARDFASVPPLAMRLAEVGLAASIFVLVAGAVEASALVPLALAAYFAGVAVYAARRFHAASTGANGITQRRLRAITWATVLFGATILAAGVGPLFGDTGRTIASVVSNLCVLSSAILYLVGFVPPSFVRRLWQEPELIAFLNHTVHLPRAASIPVMIEQIERGAAEILGAPNATIGLHNTDTDMIEYYHRGRHILTMSTEELIGGRSFTQQRPLLSIDALKDDPANHDLYVEYDANAVMAAPITADDHRIGVLAVFSPNAPIFAQDDLDLISLVADQTAILLENRLYFEHAAELRAREEAIRLKDDFLSSAAHDLKTPLTTIVAAGQFLERRLRRANADGPELTTAQRLNRESRRLQTLVQELLDASRVEQGRLIIQIEPTDLVPIVREVCELRAESTSHRIVVDLPDSMPGEFDIVRIQQLIENLVENAIKYSPDGGEIIVRGWVEDDSLRLSVTDQGIGISPSDQPSIFDRFHRGKNVDDRLFSGMGLGLFICKGIVDQHGGEIWVESELTRGSTFHVSLPAHSGTGREITEPDSAGRRRLQHSPDAPGDSIAGGISGTDGAGWARGATSD